MLPGCIQLIEREFDSYFEKANRIVGYVASDDHRTGLTDKINTMSTHFHAVMSEMEPVVPVTPAVVPVDETRVSELKQRLHQANQQIEDMERQKSFLRRQNKSMRKTDDKARKQADQEREAQAVRGSFMNVSSLSVPSILCQKISFFYSSIRTHIVSSCPPSTREGSDPRNRSKTRNRQWLSSRNLSTRWKRTGREKQPLIDVDSASSFCHSACKMSE